MSFGVVYKITCLKNNRVYIGQTAQYAKRIKIHKRRLSNGKHESKELQKDYNKFGVNNFVFEILEECDSREQLLQRETFWIDYYGGINNNSNYNHMNHLHKSELSKKLISQNHARTLTEQHKDKIRHNAKINPNYGFKGKHLSEEQRLHLSQIRKGTKLSKTTCEKISKANKVYSDTFVQQLKKDYIILGTYAAVARKYNINPLSVSRLIRFGTANTDKIYK